LQQLESSLCENETSKEKTWSKDIMDRNWGDESKKVVLEKDWEIEDECDICMEICTKMVLPTCSHEMCINCYRDWYVTVLPLKIDHIFIFQTSASGHFNQQI
jgi:Zinc finger, C3HC4 type (RING finger)